MLLPSHDTNKLLATVHVDMVTTLPSLQVCYLEHCIVISKTIPARVPFEIGHDRVCACVSCGPSAMLSQVT